MLLYQVIPWQTHSTLPHLFFLLKMQVPQLQNKMKRRNLNKITNPRWRCNQELLKTTDVCHTFILHFPFRPALSSWFPAFSSWGFLTMSKSDISKMLALTWNKTKIFPILHRYCSFRFLLLSTCPHSRFPCPHCQDNNYVEVTNFQSFLLRHFLYK